MWRNRIYTVLTVPAFGLLYLYTIIIVLILLPVLFMNMKRPARSIMRFWAHTMFYIIGRRLRIEGRNRISPGNRYILLANHSSLFDILAIIYIHPNLSWFGHERLTRIPVFKKVLKKIDYIPMSRSGIGSTKKMLSNLVEMSEKRSIGIFPEGTRTLTGELNDFYRGFIMLMRNSEMDLLPVTLNGFYELKPKNRFHISFHSRLKVVIHEPIKNKEISDKSDLQIISTVKGIIESGLLKSDSNQEHNRINEQ